MSDLPSVSCLCLTYGRFALLEEAIECFLRQDYPGDMELIVLNDHVAQSLSLLSPRVRVVNLPVRCASLGMKRNIAATYATKELVATWGDDDIHLPWRISRLVRAYQTAGAGAVLDGRHYILFRGAIELKAHSTMGSLLVRRSLLKDVGGVPEINSGEDLALIERLRAKGPVPECQEDPPGFLYRWDSPRMHISQLGPDKHGSTTGWARYDQRVRLLMEKGLEPTGHLPISPRWHHDYVLSTKLGKLVPA